MDACELLDPHRSWVHLKRIGGKLHIPVNGSHEVAKGMIGDVAHIHAALLALSTEVVIRAGP